jgi:flavin-binding protein dodecin
MAVAKVTEIFSSSPKSFEDAVQKGIARARRPPSREATAAGQASRNGFTARTAP